MTIIRVGTTQKYAEGWELAFGKGSKRKSGGTMTAVKKKKRKAKEIDRFATLTSACLIAGRRRFRR